MTPNQRQTEAWNGAESVHYVDHADRYDHQLAPFTAAMLDRARLAPHERVLDVGCGSGAATLTAARLTDRVLGVDISEPLLEVAAARARSAAVDNVEFVRADAQTHPFEGGFDVLVSQFGLMFFDDPVAAFTNLRRALAPGGRAVFVCWQALEANEWLMPIRRALPQRVDVPPLGGLTAGPGMFALNDPDEIATLLDAAGFAGVEIEPITPTLLLGGGGTFDDSVDFLLSMGIVRGLLGQVDDGSRSEVIDAVRDALAARYTDGVGIRLGAGGWLVWANVS